MVGGARLTGRAGRFSIGALNIQTDDKPSARAVATNFTAVRLKRNILRRSNIGVMTTARAPAAIGQRRQLHGRRRRDAAVLQEHQPHELLRADQHAGRAAATTVELSRPLRLHRRSLRRRRRAHADRRATSGPRSATSGAPTSAAASARRASARGRSSSRLIRKLTWQGELRLRHRRAAARRCRTARPPGSSGSTSSRATS